MYNLCVRVCVCVATSLILLYVTSDQEKLHFPVIIIEASQEAMTEVY